MATITAVSLDHINSAFGTTVKSPIDIAKLTQMVLLI